jgi:hypothetical protein
MSGDVRVGGAKDEAWVKPPITMEFSVLMFLLVVDCLSSF